MNSSTNIPESRKLKVKKNFKSSKKIRLNGIDMFIQEKKNISCSKPGVIISKKNISKAVLRNKYKRLIREVVRLDFKDLKDREIFFVVNKKILDFDFNRIRKELLIGRKRITK